MSAIGIAICLDPDVEAELIREIESRDLPLKVVRRCRDSAEMLAAMRAHLVELVVIDTERIDLDAPTRNELSHSGVAIVAFTPLDDAEFLGAVSGISVLVKDDPRLAEPSGSEANRILTLVTELIMPPPPPDPHEALVAQSFPPDSPPPGGKILAFWGSRGAPGKSSIALNLATGLGSYGKVLLVDADTVEPSLVQMLGFSLETSGVIMGCRLAERGQLSTESFSEIVTAAGAHVDFLSGINKTDRWREVGAKSLAALLEWLRKEYDWILVDLAAGADEPDDTFLGMGTSRNGAQTGALEVADLVVEVGLGDPVGLRRLILNHEMATEHQLWDCPCLVVANRGRVSVGGMQWEKSLKQILGQFIPGVPIVCLREAGSDFDRALVAGCDIATVNPEAEVLADFEQLQSVILQTFGRVPHRNNRKKWRRKKKFRFSARRPWRKQNMSKNSRYAHDSGIPRKPRKH